MDVSHIALIALELPAKAFATYNCHDPIALSLNIEILSKLLKTAGNNNELTIKYRVPATPSRCNSMLPVKIGLQPSTITLRTSIPKW
jgi:hypothetical protein